MQIPQKKIRMTYDPTIPLFTGFPREMKFLYQKICDTSHVYCSISHEGENVDPLQCPSLGDREQVICLRYASHSNLGKIQEHCVKRNKPDPESSFAEVQYGAVGSRQRRGRKTNPEKYAGTGVEGRLREGSSVEEGKRDMILAWL